MSKCQIKGWKPDHLRFVGKNCHNCTQFVLYKDLMHVQTNKLVHCKCTKLYHCIFYRRAGTACQILQKMSEHEKLSFSKFLIT